MTGLIILVEILMFVFGFLVGLKEGYRHRKFEEKLTPACPDCGRPMTRRSEWVCMWHEESEL